MMIQVNLLPGAKKKVSGASFNFAGVGAAISDRVRDPWLVGASGAVAVAFAAVGILFTTQQARATEIEAKIEVAVRDSARYEKVLAARSKLTAERDSVYRQLQIIRTIDDNRFNWAHILDEVSRALPAYTWLTILEQTSKAPLPPGIDSATVTKKKAPETKAKAVKVAPDSIEVHPELAFRLVGQTVDIQALTMFMRQLEGSPFIHKVSLTKSEIVVLEGKDVTQFELTAQYEVPAPGVLRTSPLVVPVR
ncbi:MAG: PilN domain-containing protein [Gemmatimonadota bacterium]